MLAEITLSDIDRNPFVFHDLGVYVIAVLFIREYSRPAIDVVQIGFTALAEPVADID